jgi:hypothetical protein
VQQAVQEDLPWKPGVDAAHADVVWVAHLSSTVRLSADAIVEMEAAFDELEPELRAQAAGQLRGRGGPGFERRQRVVAEELIAVAAGIRDTRPPFTGFVVIVP